MNELIPTGKLRVGVAFAPSPSPLFVVKDAGGTPRGVTVDLANELANELGVPVELMVAPNTGELVDALEAETIDVSFMPVDEEPTPIMVRRDQPALLVIRPATTRPGPGCPSSRSSRASWPAARGRMGEVTPRALSCASHMW